MLQRVNEDGLRWDFTKGSLKGLQIDDELTSHVAGHTVQCGVDQTKNPTVNSPHLIHSTRRRVDFGLPSTQTVLLLSVFPSRSLPDRPFSSKEGKNRGFHSQAFVP